MRQQMVRLKQDSTFERTSSMLGARFVHITCSEILKKLHMQKSGASKSGLSRTPALLKLCVDVSGASRSQIYIAGCREPKIVEV